jgi:serine protease
MIKVIQKNFILILSIVILALSVTLGVAIIKIPSTSVDHNQIPPDVGGTNATINQSSYDFPSHREAVIVYFKEMPASMDGFASLYCVTTIFVKDDIRMAAFETEPQFIHGVTGEKTQKVIAKMSNDSRIEQVKKDMYMFVDKKQEINATPEVRYPEYYIQKGIDYVPNQVIIGFWRLPSSLEEFGAHYGGRPINVTEGDLELQSVLFETEDIRGFIDRVSKDPYVKYIDLNVKSRIDDLISNYEPMDTGTV